MNVLEAEWLGRRLAELPDRALFPLLNVGSSTGEFRTVIQPHIDRCLFAPLRARGGQVIHADLKTAPGVDLAGDLLDPAFQARLRGLGVRSVLVSNLLEHVTDPCALCRTVLGLVPAGGHVIVSGPRDYPYHPDPIDTMFRPALDEVATLFPGTTVLAGEIVDSGNWRRWNPVERGRSLPRTLLRLLTPFYRPAKWLEVARQAPYLLKPITAYALVLRKD